MLSFPQIIPSLPGVFRDFTMYYDEISRFDEHIGQMIDELKTQDILDQPGSFQGKSLNILLTQQDKELHDAVFAEHN